jgi:hypothetical protein
LKDKSELKSGWLNQDMQRAERRVNEWKIRKFDQDHEQHDSDGKTENEEVEEESQILHC